MDHILKCNELQVADAVEYIHAQKIIHRDLKLGNLFINNDMALKIGDFGLATTVDHEGERKKTLCGTPNYIARKLLLFFTKKKYYHTLHYITRKGFYSGSAGETRPFLRS